MPHLARLAHLNLANQEKRSSFVVVHRRMLVCQTTVELECQYASVTILCSIIYATEEVVYTTHARGMSA